MKKSFGHIAILLLFFGCTKEEITPREYPRVSTTEVVNITKAGATFKGEIIFSNVEVKDHGFVWSDVNGPLVSNSNKVSLGSRTDIGQFEALSDRSLQDGKKYFMRAYAVSEDFVVYGNTIEFISLGSKAPVFKDFFPSLGTWNDSVTVVGENFSDQNRDNIVKFGEHTATVLRSNKDTVLVLVPFQLNSASSNLSVSIFGNVANLPSKQFTLKGPVIESISPSEGAPGSTVILTGKFFNGTSTKVYFNGIEGSLQTGTQKSVTVKAPNSMSPGPVEVKVVTGSGSLFDITSFTVKPPELLQISPSNGAEGDEIKLIGNFFSPEIGNNIVTFGNSGAIVTSATPTELKVIVPPHVATIDADVKVTIGNSETSSVVFSFLAPVVESFTPTSGYGRVVTIIGKNFRVGAYNEVFIGDVQLSYAQASTPNKIEGVLLGITNTHLGKVKVKFQSQEGVSAQDFRMTWAKLADFPDPDAQPTASFINSNNAYVGLGSNIFNKLWRFNSTTKAWAQMANFPGQSRESYADFTAGTKGYCGGGYANSLLVNDWWEYNFANNTWTQKSNLPMPGLVRGSFAFGGIGYVMTSDPEGSSQVSNLWKYNNTNDTWSKISTAPFTLYNEVQFFIANNMIYAGTVNDLWKYDLDNDLWTVVAPQIGTPSALMNVAGITYGFSSSHSLIKFDPVTNSWIEEPTPADSYQTTVLFSVNGRGYLVAWNNVLEFEP